MRTASWQLFEAVAKLGDHRRSAAQVISTRIAEILAADEHAIALKPALDEQQGKALRLLTDVSPPPPPRPPHPDEVVVKQAEATDLDPRRAKAVLTEITDEMAKGNDLRLSEG